MLKRKEIVEFKIEDSEFGGKGYGYVGDVKVTVKHGIPGQLVRAAIKKIKKKQAEAQVLEILENSPLEDQSPCQHFGNCGGCFQQTVAYEEQLLLKEKQVKRLFEEFAIKNYTWLGIEGSPTAFDYRNKMEFSFGDEEKGGPLTLGMHKRGRHYDIVTVDACLIMDEDFRKLLTTILDYFKEKGLSYYNTRRHEGYLRHLVIRKAHFTGEILINLVTTTQSQINIQDLVEKLLALELRGGIVGFLHTFNDNLADIVQSDKTDILYGRDYVVEELLGLKFKISAFSFFQTNSQGAEKLYSIVRDFVGEAKGQVVFDLYCGTGTIGQIVAPNAEKVVGIEIIEEAVEAARENANSNNLNNCSFIAGDVKEEVKKLKEKPDIIIIDPPRAGIHPQALKDIISFDAEKIVYVSCNPKTLVRDLVELEASGYQVDKAQLMDMFPHTPHVETVVLLSRKNPDDRIEIDIDLDELDITSAESKATYEEIKDYVLKNHSMKVSSLYISQVKRKLGIEMGINYNLPKSKDVRVPQCPPEKGRFITEALNHFRMV
ncbi:23S rRNA (uracil-5-)-methyltransferase RumA [Clostridium aceticum]|uniref:23S rRNA (Uracil-5-)-methyltransferase RumA n=2 Tax=Clostridium aceticum TaxID=84022 RepID=A0A0D8I9D7_9CLOT|nr:23S rRNA (uracil(1939)-C(5))-methyltransferase RlmD [Clostridium aceticum]AKL96250.1 23S rRNA (uracil-5-)-methyltransferase RumA [Clostridium aceticum]KJF26657.1 RNA methyltransferase [Clostridium aceticum]